MKETCCNCIFQTASICHRFPPPFPMVKLSDWCGEFKADDAGEMAALSREPDPEDLKEAKRLFSGGAPPQP